ncbi:MAG: hypothetical protein LCH84_00315 [Gemmatimonadetes bacterium]|nr:hypothetical protein [Gemmatimonadota bacterium]
MLRRLLATGALAAAAVVSIAATAPRLLADLTGKWNVTISAPDQARQALMTVTQKGDSVSGTIETELGSAPLAGVVKGDSVWFSFTLNAGGQQLPLNAAAAMKDKDNMNGALEITGMGAFPFSAQRQP